MGQHRARFDDPRDPVRLWPRDGPLRLGPHLQRSGVFRGHDVRGFLAGTQDRDRYAGAMRRSLAHPRHQRSGGATCADAGAFVTYSDWRTDWQRLQPPHRAPGRYLRTRGHPRPVPQQWRGRGPFVPETRGEELRLPHAESSARLLVLQPSDDCRPNPVRAQIRSVGYAGRTEIREVKRSLHEPWLKASLETAASVWSAAAC